MSFYVSEYKKKLMSAECIADQIESGFVCASGICLSEPRAITRAVGELARQGKRKNMIHHQNMSVYPSPFLEKELNGKYSAVSWFSTPYSRNAFYDDSIDLMPNYFRDCPSVYLEYVDVDVFYATVSPMDEHGFFSFGTTGAECQALAQKARYIYLEVNPYMPRTFGDQHIHISNVDGICENAEPLAEAKPIVIDEISQKIGEYVAEEIQNGSTIQLGIGAIPEAVGLCLKDKKNLGIHTELFTDSMMELIECGAVNNTCKNIHVGKSVATLAYGSQKLYQFLNNNVGIEFYPVNYVNDPAVIAKHDNFISVNSCIEVDLWGQVVSESIGNQHFSGSGGQVDYVRGARLSKGGKSFIAIPSTAKKGSVSRIKSTLTPGSVVTTSKNDVDYIVTEYGVAKLKGCTAKQRVQNLVQIAHPNFREELLYDARKMHLM